MVLYLSGQLRPVMIPEMPMFLTYNIALVRKGMDLSHMAEGLTHPENFDPLTGAWKPMEMDIAWVRVYQDDTQVVSPLSPSSPFWVAAPPSPLMGF